MCLGCGTPPPNYSLPLGQDEACKEAGTHRFVRAFCFHGTLEFPTFARIAMTVLVPSSALERSQHIDPGTKAPLGPQTCHSQFSKEGTLRCHRLRTFSTGKNFVKQITSRSYPVCRPDHSRQLCPDSLDDMFREVPSTSLWIFTICLNGSHCGLNHLNVFSRRWARADKEHDDCPFLEARSIKRSPPYRHPRTGRGTQKAWQQQGLDGRPTCTHSEIANSTEYNKNVEQKLCIVSTTKTKKEQPEEQQTPTQKQSLLSKAPLSVYICQPWMELPPGHVNVCGPKQYKCKSFKRVQQFCRRHLQYPAVIQPSTVNCHTRPGSSLQNPGKNVQLHIAQR